MTLKNILKNVIGDNTIRTIRIELREIRRVLKGRKKIETGCDIIEISNDCCDTFFGYYDITPFNSKGEIIYHELAKHQESIDIIINTLDGTNKKYITKSNAWNWQQGTRLRWFGDSDHIISFNDYDGKHYFNRVIDLEANTEIQINYPLYDIDKNAKLGLSLNFERLGVLRPGYGYTCREYIASDLIQEGIKVIDLSTQEVLQAITYPEIASLYDREVKIENCYINHLAFSPSGNKFLFFWIEIINGFHQASLIAYDLANKKMIPLELEMKASHYVWENDNSIICTCYDNNYKCRYYRYNVETRERILICKNTLSRDGHPSLYMTPDTILTDTYPDQDFYQHLMLVNINSDKKQELVSIYSDPYVRGEKRTDLHPRFNSEKTMICFDANVKKNRKIYLIKI